MIAVFIPDIPELLPIVRAARGLPECRVREPVRGYWVIEADRVLELRRKELGLGPALWNAALSGGFRGRIVQYDRDRLRLESEVA
jgi:hypothetical protein